MKKNNILRGNFILIFLIIVLMISVFVMAIAPSWGTSSEVNYSTVEGNIYYHNLSSNVTGFANDVTFAINTVSTNITWENDTSEIPYNVSESDIAGWIKIYDSSTGNLTINATYNNQTGFFKIPIQATNTTGEDAATTEIFEFQINATNDAPNYTNLSLGYNLTQGTSFVKVLEALDEENHYPLKFNITFGNDCTHAVGASRTNCSLFAFETISNTTASLNFTPTSEDVGIYYANITVSDYGANYACPHAYCVNSTYKSNKTSEVFNITFNLLASLSINISNCENSILTEDVPFSCNITITSTGQTDSLNLSSYATFRNYAGAYDETNRDWFYANSTVTATNFSKTVNVSVTPTKLEVGNWTINLTVNDTTSGVSLATEQIRLFVNWTEESVTLDSISNITVYENTTFQVNATDNDLSIWDLSVMDENLTFASNNSNVTIVSTSTTAGNNYTTATILINFDSFVLGGDANHTVRINVSDVNGSYRERNFTIAILGDTAATWNSSKSYSNISNEGDNVYINLTNGWVNDTEGDTLTFSFINDSQFNNFNLTTAGIINFTSSDADVGYHNITINASDGKLNSIKSFNFTIYNVVDTPTISSLTGLNVTPSGSISNGQGRVADEDVNVSFTLIISDNDFLIPTGQESTFYNESLNVSVNITNSTNNVVNLFEFSLNSYGSPSPEDAKYLASFVTNDSIIGNYTVFINISDAGGSSVTRTFYLNITEVNDLPILSIVQNQTVVVNSTLFLDINATDQEDSSTLPENGALTYTLVNITSGGNFLNFSNNTLGIINYNLNDSHAGFWVYNISVNDSNGAIASQLFNLTVYGGITLNAPAENIIFNLTENVASLLNFTLNHSVGDNLTYEFYIDHIDCAFQNNTNCNYTNSSLRQVNSSYGNAFAFNWSFTPNYTDETYGRLINLTLSVYPNNTLLNSSQRESIRTNFSFSLNVSHTNAPPTVHQGFGSSSGTYGSSSPISLSLANNFRDYDYLDSYYLENVTFFVSSNSSNSIIRADSYDSANRLTWNGTLTDWSLRLYGEEAGTELVTISANDSSGNATASPFSVTFTAPSTTTVTTSGGGGGSSEVKHFSLKLIVPRDVIISENNFIEVPFSVQNDGQVDLKGINLNSFVRFNDEFNNNVKISLADSYIEELKFGQSENFTMRIDANTQKSGRYKATILANVTSPKFSDYGDFFIDLRKTNESEAEQLLIFIEKLISENPECLELSELFKEAEIAFSLGEFSNAVRLAEEVTNACEDAIKSNEQIRYSAGAFVEENFSYISFAVLIIFFVGFIFYIYKRVKFNKSKVEDYYGA